MAGAMRKMAVYLGLVEDENDRPEGYYEEEEWEYDEPTPAPTRRARTPDRAEPRTVTVVDPNAPRRMYRDEPSNVSPIAGPSVRTLSPAAALTPAADLNRITTIHPHTYNDARRIGEEFRELGWGLRCPCNGLSAWVGDAGGVLTADTIDPAENGRFFQFRRRAAELVPAAGINNQQ